ncbi:MAG: Streptothricin acetyltransferase, Streptomyces lavendulae type, partial [uncultured Acidimicrobiales bacterium]
GGRFRGGALRGRRRRRARRGHPRGRRRLRATGAPALALVPPTRRVGAGGAGRGAGHRRAPGPRRRRRGFGRRIAHPGDVPHPDRGPGVDRGRRGGRGCAREGRRRGAQPCRARRRPGPGVQDGRPHVETVPGGRQPAVPAARLRPTGHQRLPDGARV